MNSVNSFKPQLHDMLNAMHMMAEGMSGVFVTWGIKLLFFIYALSLAWILIDALLGEDMIKTIANIVKKTIVTVFVWSLLLGWTPGSMQAGSWLEHVSVQDFFLKVSAEMADKIGSAGSAVVGVDGCGNDATCSIVELYSTAILNTLEYPVQRKILQLDYISKQASDAAGGGAVGAAAGYVAVGWEYLKSKIPGMSEGDSVLATLLGQIFSFGIALILVWSMVVFVFIINLGDVMIYTAVTFGPLMLPFLLLDRFQCLNSLPCGWFGLALSGTFYKAVATFLAFLAVGSVKLVLQYSVSPQDSMSDSAIFIAMVMVFFAWFSKELIESTGTMVPALTNGSSARSDGADALIGFVSRVSKGQDSSSIKSSKPTGSASKK